MYRVESPRALLRTGRAVGARARGPAVPRTVVLLGICSLLTDVSSEMVATVLPLYLVTTLGFSPLQFGIVDGLYQGAGAFVRLAAGYAGDRLRRHKEVAAVGYGISAVCKLALAVVGSAFGAISAIVLFDRAGKGIRTAPRDAMISLSSPPGQLGASFGVHRALDTAGAMLGPLVAFGLLALTPGDYSSLFLVAFCFAIAGFGVLVLLVDDPARAQRSNPVPAVRMADIARLFRIPALRGLAIAAVLLGIATVSDGFIYLTLQQDLNLDPLYFPLLFTGTALVYMLLATPAGRLADRIGRGRVLVAGYGLLLCVYGLLLAAPTLGIPGLLLALALLGTYYAATDGVLMALASAWVPEELRGSGLAALGTAVSGARFAGSVLFGLLWTAVDVQLALACFAGALVVSIVLASATLRSHGT